MKSSFTARVVLALLVTVVFWASAFAGIRVGLQGYPPAHLAILRFVIASVVLAIYAALSHFRLPQHRDVPGIAVASFLGITFYNIALNYGETRVPAGTASLLIASTPIWTALFASLALKERLRIWGWIGIFVSFVGAGIIALSEGHGVHFSKHALIIMAASCCSAIYIVMQKHYLGRYSALEFTAYSIWMGTFLMLPFSRGLFHSVVTASAQSTQAVIYLGVCPAAMAYLAWGYVLSHAPASRTVSLLYLIPVFAIFIAWIWLLEIPAPLSLLGGALALAGVLIVNLMGRSTQAPAKAVALKVAA
jgi:drug/metabolite transporter (DMT)-like permease